MKERKLAPRIEWLFKRCIDLALGEGFKKDFIRSKKPKKKKTTMAVMSE